jgi:hypothetical protein
VRPFETLKDVLHAATNSLTLISSHSQYLLGKLPRDAPGVAELQIIYEEAERAASLLSLVPQGLAQSPIQTKATARLEAAAKLEAPEV